jgi:hypothetical protein
LLDLNHSEVVQYRNATMKCRAEHAVHHGNSHETSGNAKSMVMLQPRMMVVAVEMREETTMKTHGASIMWI